MSLLVVGLSHHTAPLEVLETLAGQGERAARIATEVMASATASEVVVLSTCNRLEVYAESPAFHPAVAAVRQVLTSLACADDLVNHLYVRFDDSAVAHAFEVACGLDSMAVGETQVLGQLREALTAAQRAGSVGASLNSLFQQALRVGKRAHAETTLDQHSGSLVQTALAQATTQLGPLEHLHAAVIGAGGMSGLAAATTSRAGIASLTVVGRTLEKAERLASAVGGRVRPWPELGTVIAESDLVITCTGATGRVITAGDLERSSEVRSGAPQLFVDLALPRDVDPHDTWSRPIAGVTVVDLQQLGDRLAARGTPADPALVTAVRELITGEVGSYVARRVEQQVGPTVAALRARAAALVAAELSRLDQRVPDLDDTTRAEVGLAVHRIVEKLLHTPTVRVKEFALDQGGADYPAVLRELFDLDPKDVATVAAPPQRGGT